MRATTIHVTDHAKLRWVERISENSKVEEIIDLIKKSKIIRKDEDFPFPHPRIQDTTYAAYEDIIFIMECVNIDEYVLVTVVKDDGQGHPSTTFKSRKLKGGQVGSQRRKRRDLHKKKWFLPDKI